MATEHSRWIFQIGRERYAFVTHVRLAETNEEVLAGALRTAWRLRIEKNAGTGRKKRASAVRGGAAKNKGKKR